MRNLLLVLYFYVAGLCVLLSNPFLCQIHKKKSTQRMIYVKRLTNHTSSTEEYLLAKIQPNILFYKNCFITWYSLL